MPQYRAKRLLKENQRKINNIKRHRFEIFINRLEKKYKLVNLKIYLTAVFKNETENKENIYQAAWILIHFMHSLDPFDQLEIFFKILRIFSTQNCICGQDAFVIFKSLFNDDLKNFYQLADFKEFWIYFHNLINLKLDKPIFKFQETN